MLQVFPFLNGCNFYNTVFPYSCCIFFYNGSRVCPVEIPRYGQVRGVGPTPRSTYTILSICNLMVSGPDTDQVIYVSNKTIKATKMSTAIIV